MAPLTPEEKRSRRSTIMIVLGVILVLAIVAVVAFLSGAFKATDRTDCTIAYDALDPANPAQMDPAKEVPAALGVAVTQRDEAGIKAELDERRECEDDDQRDTELVATHYVAWSMEGARLGVELTSHTLTLADVDSFREKMNADEELYKQVIAELHDLEGNSAFSIEEVALGTPTVYVALQDGALFTGYGHTTHAGTAAVFTHPSGAVVKYRLECGFQVVWPTPPTDIPCVADCNPCPPGNTTPSCAPKSSNPDDYTYPDDKPPVTANPTADSTPPAVTTEQTGGGGVIDTPTNDPGTETGVTAPGADPAPTTPASPPPNEGGDNDAGDPGGF